MLAAPIEESSVEWWPQRDSFAEPPRTQWTLRSALVVLGVGDLCGFITVQLLHHAFGVERLDAVVGALLAMGPLCLLAGLVAHRHREATAVAFGLIAAPIRPAIVAVVAATLGLSLFSVIYSAVVAPFLGVPRSESVQGDSTTIVLLVLSPFLEELFYRGFLYRAVRNVASAAVSCCAVGTIFAVDHLWNGTSLRALPYLAAIGIVLCVVYELTDSLLPCIALHAVINIPAAARVAHLPSIEMYGVAVGLTAAALSWPRVKARPGGR